MVPLLPASFFKEDVVRLEKVNRKFKHWLNCYFIFYFFNSKINKKQATLIHFLEIRINELEELLNEKQKKNPKNESKMYPKLKSFVGCWTVDCAHSIINKFLNFNQKKINSNKK